MHDLGYSQLRIVNEFPVPFAAAKSAVDASQVLEAATEHTTLAAALADCTLVLGTTAVGDRVLEHPLYLLPQAASVVAAQLASNPRNKVALLFGSEKTGLSNLELSHCHALVTIPMNQAGGRHLSMNLGQAAAVCLYQLALEPAPLAAPTAAPPASAAELDRILTLLTEVLGHSGYTRRYPANSREAALRRMVYRMRLSTADATVWTGILRQLLHAATRMLDERPEEKPV